MTTTTGASRALSRLQFIDSTELLSDPAALRERAAQEGYLFFRSRVPADEILALRREMLAVVERFGLRQRGQDDLGGLLDCGVLNAIPTESLTRPDIGVTAELYHEVQKIERFHRLPHHPRLLEIYEALFGRPVLVHPRHIARMITPHPTMVPTPPHQDFPYIQGSAETWTAWFPIGDCPKPLGPLAILRASHRSGYLPVQPAKGAGGFTVPLCPQETEWVEGDFEIGDVLTFPCYTIHRAMRCQHKDRIRLSLDVRYQPAGEPIEARSLKPHCPLSWEEIYAGWNSDELKYYWKNQTLNQVDWDDSYLQPKRRIC